MLINYLKIHGITEESSLSDVFLDSFLDALKVLLLCLLIFIVLSFFYEKLFNLLKRNKKLSIVYGSLFGAIPQCGIPVISQSIYSKRGITIGCLVAIFLSCSDEAIPVLLATPKWYVVFYLILIKIIYGLIIGFIVDLIFKKKEELNIINDEYHKGGFFHDHILHPFLDSMKIFIYAFIINICFGLLFHYIGEEKIETFLQSSKYLQPIYSIIIGLIPNCASSIIISNLYVSDLLNFSSLLAGLCVNAGLGLVFLIKDKKTRKDVIKILPILVISSLIIGYSLYFVNI